MYDYDEIVPGVNHTNDFIGKITIHTHKLMNHALDGPTWYKLRNKHNKTDEKARGQLHLMIQWVHSTTARPQMPAGRGGGGMFGLGGGSPDDATDDDEDDEMVDEEDVQQTPEELAKQKQEREEAEAKLRSQLMDYEIKSGDYQIQVHVIEGRELKAKDYSGTSDPVVFVEMDFGEHKQKQNTAVISKQLSCVWDELLIFNLRNVDREEFESDIDNTFTFSSNLLEFGPNFVF